MALAGETLMPDSITVPLPGFAEVFESRTGIVGRDLLLRANRVIRAAQRQVGVHSGELKKSIGLRWKLDSGVVMSVSIDAERPYAVIHHDGTKPHIIRPINGKALRFIGKDGQVVFAKSTSHPGTKANRYLLDNLPLAVI